MERATLEALLAARADGRVAVLATDLATGAQRLVDGDDDPLAAQARAAATADRSQVVNAGGTEWMLTVVAPPLDLRILGAVHIAQPLAAMAALAGWAVTVIDPRAAFATDARFPGVQLDTLWPDEALANRPPGARSAVVALTHDPKLDDPGLAAALRSPALYVGALGSQKTHAARRERLRAQGFSDADLARIHGPVGLSIGARTPGEIAVAILAQMTAVARGARA